MRRKRGQSILEYVIVLTAIVAAIAFVAAQFLGPAVQKTGQDATITIEKAGGRLPQ